MPIPSFIQRLIDLIMAAVMALTGLLSTGQMPIAKIPVPETGPLTQYVNPFVGSGAIVPWGCGMTNPGACAPFGAVRLAPDTCWPFGLNITNVGTGGYWRAKTRTFGFSHTRVSGAGLIEGGNFRVTPGLDGADPLKRLERPLLFTHAREAAVAGYYGVWLPEAACLAELTATQHTGVHRYTFKSDKDAHLFFDASSNLKHEAQGASIRIIDEKTLEGAWNKWNTRIYYYAEFDTPFEAVLWKDGALLPGETEASSAQKESDSLDADVGADLNFGSVKDKPITMRLGLSYVSPEGAKANLEAESAGMAFDAVYAGTRDAWEDRLASVKITTGDNNIKRVFYTAMYHAMIHPTYVADVTGDYVFQETCANATDFTFRGDLSLWDTFRTTHAFYCLVAPDIQKDSAQSLLVMAESHGGFPRWPKTIDEGGSMFGNPAHQVMTETYLKGLMDRDDAITSLEVMKNTAYGTAPAGKRMNGRQFYQEYLDYGYIPSELRDISVSMTLEYAWADYSSYLLAEALGEGYEDDAAAFYDMSMNFKNVFDPATKYFRPRNAAGEWQLSVPWAITYIDDVIPLGLANGFSEGSARHYRWHAIQDPAWLIENMGGKEAFVKELEAFMGGSSLFRAGLNPGPNWWVGNQHNYHAPYMFNEAGRPDLTQKWVRWTLAERFADSPDGLDGNEDLGALSGWYIFGALGFYPVAGTDRYWFGSPNVDQAVLDLGGGKTLTVKATNQGPKNVYVKSVKLNGVAMDPSKTFSHELIKDGGTMEFEMAAKP